MAARGAKQRKEPTDRIEIANDVARVQPRRAGYFNAVQIFPYSASALYQIYASPGQITDIELEPGEQLIGSRSLAAGDTVRWIVGTKQLFTSAHSKDVFPAANRLSDRSKDPGGPTARFLDCLWSADACAMKKPQSARGKHTR